VKRLLSISLSILLLFSNIGLSIASHYCGGQKVLSELVIGHNQLDCGMIETLCEEDDKNQHPSFSKKSCCENRVTVLDSKETLNTQLLQIEINTPFLIAFTYYCLHIHFSEDFSTQFTTYLPPSLKIDRQAMFQAFLLYDKSIA
jgi:hypothetical protein